MSSTSLAPSGQARSLATPVKQTPPPVRESPGNWKHPRLAEITRRQSKTTFNEKNIRQIVYNIGALGIIAVLRRAILPIWTTILASLGLKEYNSWLFTLLFVFPLFNIGVALLPLIRPSDDLSDIPLTPSQRKLLGLPPSSKPVTPGSAISTPPRYTRTPSIGGSPASLRSHMSSPSASGQGGGQRSNNSPYSPSASASSPLFHKVVGQAGQRRSSFGQSTSSSFGTSTGLGASSFGQSTSSFSPSTGLGASFGGGASTSTAGGGLLGASSTSTSLYGPGESLGPGTPTPATGKRSSVSLNNKWLYERGRRASSNSFLGQSFGA
ncbi:Nuclear pore complex component domain containing protein [Rhypophila decipiens]